MPLPLLPQKQLSTTSPTPSGLSFPQNVANQIPQETLTEMTRFMVSEYILPQVMERRPYESLWDLLLQMYKIKLSRDNVRFPESDAETDIKDRQADNMKGSNRAQVSDSLVYDAVDRLKNLNHFISWKDGIPIKFQPPTSVLDSKEDKFYFPETEKYRSYNGLLEWNIRNQDVYRKHLILSQHHYLYGICFVSSDFVFKQEQIQKQNNEGQLVMMSEITDLGITFKPTSIRRIWLNYRQPIYDMNQQNCPFLFEQIPRFAILQNGYNPNNNPFGYVNLDKLDSGQWMFSQPEMEMARKAMEERLESSTSSHPSGSLTELLRPEYSVEALWTFHPMLPFDDKTGEWKMRKDGVTPVPLKRFIFQVFANNLMSGSFTPIRIQANFYPRNAVPIYGSQHMPDLDSGMYSPAIGEVLENHYKEICTAMNQFIDNKNRINDPPSTRVIGSPATDMDCNAPGAKVVVNSPHDVDWAPVVDATASTVEMIKFLREQGQTSSKAVDAILGKALGGRTSATEAQNVFQAAMSGVTTDINLFNYDIMGGYADRVWEITGIWFSPELLKTITGMYGPQLQPEDMWARVDKKWDVGSAYIESITKQGNLRYAIEAGTNSPVLNQAILWRQLFIEMKMPSCLEAIEDGGFEVQVYEATNQAIETYMGQQVIFDPAQDHQTAIEVKVRFLKDKDSQWNVQYGALPSPLAGMSRAQYLAEQIQMHQKFAMLQLQQQLVQQQLAGQAAAARANPPEPQGQADMKSGRTPTTPGQQRQSTGV